MKRIAFIIPIYLPSNIDGSATVVKDLAEVAARKGYEVTVITSDALTSRYWYDPIFGRSISEKSETIEGVHVTRLKSRYIIASTFFILNKLLQPILMPYKENRFLRRISEWLSIRSNGPWVKGLADAIIQSKAELYVIAPFPLWICRASYDVIRKNKFRYSVIPFMKEGDIFRISGLAEILRYADAVFCPTLHEKKYIKSIVREANALLLPSTVDISYIKKHTQDIKLLSARLRETKQFRNKKIILFAGRKGPKKGVIDAAEAVRNLHDDSVVFCAMGENMPEWDEYLSKHPDGNIDIPYTSGAEKYAYYQLCDVFILPSTSDNFPLVFLEAWQFSKPVLAYDQYSIREILSDGSGFLAQCNNVKDLSRTLLFILRHSNEAAKAGRIGHMKVTDYSRERIAEKFFIEPINHLHT